MISKKTLVQQYEKYLDAIKQGDGNNLILNFSKFTAWLSSKCEDSKLWNALELAAINNAIVQIKKKNIMLKYIAWKWNHEAVQECYRLLKIIETVPYEVNEEQYMVNEARLFKLIDDQEDPALQLFLYLRHYEKPDGKRLYESSKDVVEKLLVAASDEEIDEILHPGEKQAETSTPHTESEVLEEAVAAIPAVEV